MYKNNYSDQKKNWSYFKYLYKDYWKKVTHTIKKLELKNCTEIPPKDTKIVERKNIFI